MIQDRFIT